MSRETRPRLGRGLSSLIRNSIADAAAAAGQYEAVAPAPVAPPAEKLPAAQIAAAHSAVAAAQPSALAADAPAAVDVLQTATLRADTVLPSASVTGVLSIPVERIQPNPCQPRRAFAAEALGELADSIRLHGVLEPLVVCPRSQSDGQEPGYYLVAGERRLRAAQLAGKTAVPCVLRHASRQEMLELAVIENIHREDLNPVERAMAYRDLLDQFGLTQEQAAQRVGEKRSTVANHLRLLDLSNEVQTMVASGQLSFGHAKVLAALAGRVDQQALLAKRVVQENMSVRQLEELVKQLQELGQADMAAVAEPAATGATKSAYLADLERQLSETVGARVAIRPGRAKHSGRVVISYYTIEDFDRITKALGMAVES